MSIVRFLLLGFAMLIFTESCTRKNPDALLQIGNRLFESGKLAEAKKTYLKITEIAPEYTLAYHNLGIIDWRSQQYETAIGFFSKAIERDPMFGKAYLMRGRCYAQTFAYKMAENDFQSARISPDLAYDALSELGRLWVSQKRFYEAIKILNQCVQLSDTSDLVLLTRASALFEINKYESSVKDCNKVISRNPKRWEAYLIKGKNFLEMPVMDSALLVLDYARLYSGENPLTLAAISEYYLMNDESAMAIAFAEKGLQSMPENIPLKLNKARAFDGMDQYEKANVVYNEIGALADSIPEYHFYLAKNMLYLGDTASALIALSDAVALRRNYQEAFTVRSIVKARIGDAVGAAEDRERAKGNLSFKHPQRKQWERDSALMAPSM